MSNARNLANLSGTNKKQIAKAWVIFDGKTGSTATIKDSYGIQSVVRNGTGDYTITFSSAFPNTNFCMVSSCKGESSIGIYASEHLTVAATTTTIRIQTWYGYAAGALLDSSRINLAFFSD